MAHIVHLETGMHLYGGARQVLLLTQGLREHGIESTLVCPPDSAISQSVSPGVQVHTMPMAGDLDAGFGYRFSKFLESTDADLVHVHSRRGADMWGGMGAKWAKVPAVLSRRVDNPETPLMAPLKYRRYERVIGISAGIVRELRKIGVGEDRLRLVHSAIDAQTCQPAGTREDFLAAFELRPNQLVVMCVAQFIPRKGHAELLDAWGEVVTACPDARLLLFGRGPEEEALQQRVADSVAGSTIRFAGFHDNIREFIGHADVLVHPAHREGLGIALLEAQAAGVPVVASAAGGIPEAVADGESGILLEPGSVKQLGMTLTKVLRDADLRKRMGARGREHVAEHFSPRAMVSGNLDVYREVIDGL